ncbi:MAG: glycosyltransferase [Bacteroidota bacterium]|nr:glycosyltransferase [Bacteroidota bacterium]
MKITLLTIGTRGDVQPFAALGQALMRNGHEVTLSTASNFKKLVEEHHLHFCPIEANYEEILNSKEGKKIFNGNPFAINRNFDNLISPFVEGALNQFYQLAKTSELLIYRDKTLVDVFINQVDCQAIKAAVVPAMQKTIAFANPGMSGIKLPDFLNSWTYKINKLRYPVLSKPIKNFQNKNGLKLSTRKLRLPTIYGISPHFLDRPTDWPDNHYLTGFWFSDYLEPLDSELLKFLDDGPPPILLSFGSSPTKAKVAKLVLYAQRMLNLRFIIVSGWSNWDTPEINENENIKVVSSVSYQLLLPRVKAMVHHGGIGTTALCLNAGKPMFICPVIYPLGDQNFWGNQVYKKGVGIKPIPLSKLSPEVFVQSLKQLVSDKDLYSNSEVLAKKINSEDGLRKALEIIEKITSNTSKSY